MRERTYLLLDDGSVFEGRPYGAAGEAAGLLAFDTSTTGYMETLSDSGYFGQLVVQSFPLTGNYGAVTEEMDGPRIHAKGYIIKDGCQGPSNFRSEGALDTFLKSRSVVGLQGIDTRQLVKKIRGGSFYGMITPEPGKNNLDRLKNFSPEEPFGHVSVSEAYEINSDGAKKQAGAKKAAILDLGVKRSVLAALAKNFGGIKVFPSGAGPDEIIKYSPDGIIIAGGPDVLPGSNETEKLVKKINNLFEKNIPVLALGSGHQLVALANGIRLINLSPGHRGSSHPVMDHKRGRIYTTAQNHGLTADISSIGKNIADIRFTHVNDGSCEGLVFKNKTALTAQFAAEAVFDSFMEVINAAG